MKNENKISTSAEKSTSYQAGFSFFKKKPSLLLKRVCILFEKIEIFKILKFFYSSMHECSTEAHRYFYGCALAWSRNFLKVENFVDGQNVKTTEVYHGWLLDKFTLDQGNRRILTVIE